MPEIVNFDTGTPTVVSDLPTQKESLMAEIQKTTNAGESAARFIEFVMLQAQNASLFLGLIPHPQSGQPETNLELARMFIDQLAMIQDKTRGNLSSEEANVLRNALSNLQMAYVEVAQGGSAKAASSDDELAPLSVPLAAAAENAPAPEASSATVPAPPADEPRGDSKKRFSKSYGS